GSNPQYEIPNPTRSPTGIVRDPDAHWAGLAVGPCIVRNECELGGPARVPRSRFRPAPSQDAPVERLVRECALLHRASVFEDCDFAQQAGSELRPEFFPRPAAGREGPVLERPHAGLVRPLEAVTERVAPGSHS